MAIAALLIVSPFGGNAVLWLAHLLSIRKAVRLAWGLDARDSPRCLHSWNLNSDPVRVSRLEMRSAPSQVAQLFGRTRLGRREHIGHCERGASQPPSPLRANCAKSQMCDAVSEGHVVIVTDELPSRSVAVAREPDRTCATIGVHLLRTSFRLAS
jgi:hypothetical protein